MTSFWAFPNLRELPTGEKAWVRAGTVCQRGPRRAGAQIGIWGRKHHKGDTGSRVIQIKKPARNHHGPASTLSKPEIGLKQPETIPHQKGCPSAMRIPGTACFEKKKVQESNHVKARTPQEEKIVENKWPPK